MLCCVVSCCVGLRCVVLTCLMLCCVVLCCVMVCLAVRILVTFWVLGVGCCVRHVVDVLKGCCISSRYVALHDIGLRCVVGVVSCWAALCRIVLVSCVVSCCLVLSPLV